MIGPFNEGFGRNDPAGSSGAVLTRRPLPVPLDHLRTSVHRGLRDGIESHEG